ncbi:MAG TPA: dihydroorotase [Candidatus Limnocylindrales bacterium]
MAADGAMPPSAMVRSRTEVGALTDLEISRAWLVDPAGRQEGPGEIVVRRGVLETVTWLHGAEADGVDERGIVVAPGFVDLHAHLRQPGAEDAETIATGLAAAAHGGFTTVCAMPNTSPAIDEPGVLELVRAAGRASGSPVELLVHGCVSVGRRGEQLAALGELADAGAVGFSDDGSPVRSAPILRNALLYAGMYGRPVIDHPETLELTEGAEANEGVVASVLGLKGWPIAAEEAAVARDLAVLAGVLDDEPGARLHLTHVSTAAGWALVRRAKTLGLPVTADVTPHHLALTDEWLAGARRWAWLALGTDGRSANPWVDGAIVSEPYDPALRVNPPLRSAEDAAACLAALIDGTADAVATDHAPHTVVDKDVEFGLASNGISGIETALGVLLAAVDAGHLPLARAIGALTTGPSAVLSGWPGVARLPIGPVARRPGFVEGAPADLVVFDRSDDWLVTGDALASKGKNSPVIGLHLPGRVLFTIAGGRLAWDGTGED